MRARLENALGTRFVKVRSDTDPIKATEKALENAEHTKWMRVKLIGAVAYFVKNLREKGAFENPLRLTEERARNRGTEKGGHQTWKLCI